MQIVVKIPEEEYDLIVNDEACGLNVLTRAIANGIVLPKGHGRLIDVDNINVIELEDSLHILRHEKGDEIDWYIDAPTIIEADKEV